MEREADHERRAERQRTDRVSRTDGEPLPQVVQADAERDEERGRWPRPAPAAPARAVRARPVAAVRARAARQPSVHARERQERARRAEPDERRAAERRGALAGQLGALEQSLHPRKPSSPIVNASRKRIQRASTPRIQGSQSIPIATGITPT